MNLSPHEVSDCAIVEFTTRNFKTPQPLCYQLDAPLVKERPDLDPTKYRRYGDPGRSECFGADDVMNQLPNHPISKQEWFSRCRSAGIEESIFLNHFETLVSSEIGFSSRRRLYPQHGGSAMNDLEPLLQGRK